VSQKSLSPQVAEQVLKAVAALTSEEPGESALTLTVQGHRVLRRPHEFGLMLRTQEFGDVIFSLPEQIIERLIADLSRLASSSSWRLEGERTRRSSSCPTLHAFAVVRLGVLILHIIYALVRT
jgi:hypothetical protein